MNRESTIDFIKSVLEYMPNDWRKLTTHRLDIYEEELAKTQFLEELDKIFINGLSDKEILPKRLKDLPTAFDYIRLGHPLSCVLEWAIAKINALNEENVISFSSQSMPILAVLRKNLLENKRTQIFYKNELPKNFDIDVLKNTYGYQFELKKISENQDVSQINGSTIVLSDFNSIWNTQLTQNIGFEIFFDSEIGSVAVVNEINSKKYITELQHVRRRETIAMTPDDCFHTLEKFVGKRSLNKKVDDKKLVESIKEVTNASSDVCIGSSGLSIQYAIMMGLIDNSFTQYKDKKIKLIVPPNCYGGTNDQARRVAACIENVEVLDLPVDSGQNMVQSVEKVLSEVAKEDAIPFIIAEIPTNPRVEVPELDKLEEVLSKKRKTKDGSISVGAVFILDQTFCPNVEFLGNQDILSNVKTISYVSGSKFPSGGLCTAGYCVANNKARELMSSIDKHLKICANEATTFQIETLSNQMPSMNQRINDAYKKTREFVDFIKDVLPEAKINFVSKELANDGFTPSVFSLDLPTKGESTGERELYKRDLNLKLISMMINEIPNESKHCVSYGQLRGCYWTIPATSTQGTTKEGDKDYIVRVAMSAELDLEAHKKVFFDFCKKYIN